MSHPSTKQSLLQRLQREHEELESKIEQEEQKLLQNFRILYLQRDIMKLYLQRQQILRFKIIKQHEHTSSLLEEKKLQLSPRYISLREPHCYLTCLNLKKFELRSKCYDLIQKYHKNSVEELQKTLYAVYICKNDNGYKDYKSAVFGDYQLRKVRTIKQIINQFKCHKQHIKILLRFGKVKSITEAEKECTTCQIIIKNNGNIKNTTHDAYEIRNVYILNSCVKAKPVQKIQRLSDDIIKKILKSQLYEVDMNFKHDKNQVFM